ncbi:hypothetical protein WDZ92_32500, partial [Nostoc sp. NIES-2111]
MFIRLSPAFIEMSDLDVRAHEMVIDLLLEKHCSRSHLLCLSPAEVKKLRGAITFGPRALRTLDTILRRSQDYFSSFRNVRQYLLVSPLQIQTVGGHNQRQISVILSGLEQLQLPSAHVLVRPFHGGGNTLGSAIEELVGPRIQGLCIVDRDCCSSIPPFPEGKTAFSAFNALCRIGAMTIRENQLQHLRPFFRLMISQGWSLENLIGPNLAEVYFEANNRISERHRFLEVFPTFPELSDSERKEWWLVNFKASDQSADEFVAGHHSQYGEFIDPARAAKLANLTLPRDAVTWIGSSWRSGRHAGTVRTAIRRDLRWPDYASFIEELAHAALSNLSADARMLIT